MPPSTRPALAAACRCGVAGLERLLVHPERLDLLLQPVHGGGQSLLIGAQCGLLGRQVIGLGQGGRAQRECLPGEFLPVSGHRLLRLLPQPVCGVSQLAFLHRRAGAGGRDVNDRAADAQQEFLLLGIGVVEDLPGVLGPVQQGVDLDLIKFRDPAPDTHGSPSCGR